MIFVKRSTIPAATAADSCRLGALISVFSRSEWYPSKRAVLVFFPPSVTSTMPVDTTRTAVTPKPCHISPVNCRFLWSVFRPLSCRNSLYDTSCLAFARRRIAVSPAAFRLRPRYRHAPTPLVEYGERRPPSAVCPVVTIRFSTSAAVSAPARNPSALSADSSSALARWMPVRMSIRLPISGKN